MSLNNDGWDDYYSDDEPDYESPVKNQSKEKNLLRKYKSMAKNTMDENELLELIREKNYDQSEIEKEIKNKLKYIESKGEEYGWRQVGKGKKIKKLNLDNMTPKEGEEEYVYDVNLKPSRTGNKFNKAIKKNYQNFKEYQTLRNYYKGSKFQGNSSFRGNYFKGGYKQKKYDNNWNKSIYLEGPYSSQNLNQTEYYGNELTELPYPNEENKSDDEKNKKEKEIMKTPKKIENISETPEDIPKKEEIEEQNLNKEKKEEVKEEKRVRGSKKGFDKIRRNKRGDK
ncbi:MAG: hypothetical protein MJ252_19065 [archaeon]|nr:hypothetical protein [archaeon]